MNELFLGTIVVLLLIGPDTPRRYLKHRKNELLMDWIPYWKIQIARGALWVIERLAPVGRKAEERVWTPMKTMFSSILRK